MVLLAVRHINFLPSFLTNTFQTCWDAAKKGSNFRLKPRVTRDICSGVRAVGKRLGTVCTHGASTQRREPGAAPRSPGARLRQPPQKLRCRLLRRHTGARRSPPPGEGSCTRRRRARPGAALGGAWEHPAGGGRGGRPGRPRSGGQGAGSGSPPRATVRRVTH